MIKNLPADFTYGEPMFEEFLLVIKMLHVLAAISVIVALVFAIKLYRETDKRWYWLSLLLSAFFFAFSQWSAIIFPLVQSFAVIGILHEVSEILATLLFAISCYGIYSTMKKIRKRVE
jgi:hypothetical protein